MWSDGERLHVWIADGYDGWDQAIWAMDEEGKRHDDRLNASGVSISEEVIDEFVVMRLAEMIDENLVREAIDRALAHGGNFGAAVLVKNAGNLKAAIRQIRFDKQE